METVWQRKERGLLALCIECQLKVPLNVGHLAERVLDPGRYGDLQDAFLQGVYESLDELEFAFLKNLSLQDGYRAACQKSGLSSNSGKQVFQTPKGMKEKTEKTFNYIRRSYDYIMSVSSTEGELIKSADVQEAGIVYLYGPKNQMYEIIKLALQEQKGVHNLFPGEEPVLAEDVHAIPGICYKLRGDFFQPPQHLLFARP